MLTKIKETAKVQDFQGKEVPGDTPTGQERRKSRANTAQMARTSVSDGTSVSDRGNRVWKV